MVITFLVATSLLIDPGCLSFRKNIGKFRFKVKGNINFQAVLVFRSAEISSPSTKFSVSSLSSWMKLKSIKMICFKDAISLQVYVIDTIKRVMDESTSSATPVATKMKSELPEKNINAYKKKNDS